MKYNKPKIYMHIDFIFQAECCSGSTPKVLQGVKWCSKGNLADVGGGTGQGICQGGQAVQGHRKKCSYGAANDGVKYIACAIGYTYENSILYYPTCCDGTGGSL